VGESLVTLILISLRQPPKAQSPEIAQVSEPQ
jgi:hypothetical protein